MTRIGVTGTNGKTSTVAFVRQLLSHAGRRTASYGTLGLVTDSGRDPDPRISFGPRALPNFLRRLDHRGVEDVVLEAYSSSLATDVFEDVSVDVAAFTNLSRDHLDYHETMAAYFGAKKALFETVLTDDGTAVINRDDDRAGELEALCHDRGVEVRTFGWSPEADVSVRDATARPDGTNVVFSAEGTDSRVELGLVGDVMVANACCAAATCLAVGVPRDRVVDGLSELRAPPGRLERVATHRGAEVYVDYAHTPSALRAILDVLGERTSGNRASGDGASDARASGDLVVVFGCGGDRDTGKRRQMGEIAARGADAVLVTDDNPRDEDPATIRADVLEGCRGISNPPEIRECWPREDAIASGLESVGPGDVLVVAGKGHERTQIVGDETRAFSDHDVLTELVDENQ